jgi:very-short-patch-repair endonuclease
MTLPEVLLWQQLRAKKLGFKVLRQHPIGPYVVDFYVSEARLIIEVDGEVHNRADNPDRDQKRDGFLAAQGYLVMRIAAADVLNSIEGALEGIVARMENPLHHPSDGRPPRPGEEL